MQAYLLILPAREASFTGPAKRWKGRKYNLSTEKIMDAQNVNFAC